MTRRRSDWPTERIQSQRGGREHGEREAVVTHPAAPKFRWQEPANQSDLNSTPNRRSPTEPWSGTLVDAQPWAKPSDQSDLDVFQTDLTE